MQNLQPHLEKIQTFAVSTGMTINQNFHSVFTQMHNYSRFEKFIALNIVLLVIVLLHTIIKSISFKNMWTKIISMIFQIPYVKAKINTDLIRAKKEIYDNIPAYGRSKLTKIPITIPKIQIPDHSDKKIQQGSLSGTYYPMKQHSEFVASLAKKFSYTNLLHLQLHPHTQQMQVQVIKMCAKMLNYQGQDHQAYGSVTSGGTQSILMAILAYRQYGIKQRGVKKPNLVIAPTGHVAALKAADYMQIQVRTTSLTKDYKMNIRSMKSLIDSNTICVYTSFPNYPYGTVDDIAQIAKYCNKKKIPVHVDMCLGGFVVPFLQKQDGSPYFVIPKGVTSISLDPHKYGLSAKGVSVVLFSDQEILKQHYFAAGKWQGGAYGTIGIAGSRCGLPLVSAWISMMKNGVQNYTINAKRVQQAVLKLRKALSTLGYQIFGEPQICTIGFSHPRLPLGNITEQMKKKGWGLSLLQKPLAIHYSFTPINAMNIDKMIKDFQEITNTLKKKLPQSFKKDSMLQLYGVCAHIPDGPTKGLILNTILDAFSDA